MKSILCAVTVIALILLAGCNPQNISSGGDFYADSTGLSRPEETSELKDGSDKAEIEETGEIPYNITASHPKEFASQSVITDSSVKSHNNVSSGEKVKYLSFKGVAGENTELSGGAYFKATLGVSLPFSCSSAELKLECSGDITLIFSAKSDIFARIYLNGREAVKRINLKGENKAVTIKNSLSKAHTLKILRLSGGENELILTKAQGQGIRSVKAEYKNPQNIRLEFVGDSNPLGCGILLPDSYFKEDLANLQKALSPSYEDASLTYPYLVAKAISAEAFVIARPNAKLISAGIDNEEPLISELYQWACKKIVGSGTEKESADIIVLDLKGNDISKMLLEDTGTSSGQLVSRTTAFLMSLKAKNPKAKIIWCYGISGGDNRLKEFINTLTAVMGGSDEGFYSLELGSDNRYRGFAGETAHKQAADKLINKIREIM